MGAIEIVGEEILMAGHVVARLTGKAPPSIASDFRVWLDWAADNDTDEGGDQLWDNTMRELLG